MYRATVFKLRVVAESPEDEEDPFDPPPLESRGYEVDKTKRLADFDDVDLPSPKKLKGTSLSLSIQRPDTDSSSTRFNRKVADWPVLRHGRKIFGVLALWTLQTHVFNSCHLNCSYT